MKISTTDTDINGHRLQWIMSSDDPSEITVVETLPHRQVIPTEKGSEHFEQLNKPYVSRIQKVWNVLDATLKRVTEAPDELEALQSLKTNITKYVEHLENETVPYLEFLNRHNTEQSKQWKFHLACKAMKARKKSFMESKTLTSESFIQKLSHQWKEV